MRTHEAREHTAPPKASQKTGDAPRPAAKKSLGQHFLRRADICERIVRLAKLDEDARVLEIGPGPGALTKVLERSPHRELLLLEKDSYWAGVREEEAEARTKVLCTDALAYPFEELEGPWVLMGNLPYNVASPLIWEMAARVKSMRRAVFMVQKEVGMRLCAKSCSKDFGALTVWVQAHWQASYEFTVKPQAFSPPPKVDSAVCSFDQRTEPPPHPKALERLIKLAFAGRRKQLGGVFRKAGLAVLQERLESLGKSQQVRAEELSVEDFLHLSRLLAPKG